jgi:uncharacterized RDD family membrane protein YckC
MKYHNAMSYQRFLAFIIDAIIINIVASTILMFIPAYSQHSEVVVNGYAELMNMVDVNIDQLINLLKSAFIIIGLHVAVFVPLMLIYQVIVPMFWKKQTVGRMVAGVRVMKLNSSEKPGLGSLLVRELVGGYIFNTLLSSTFVLPLLNYMFSRNRGRSLADMISKTRLVDYKLAQMMGLEEEIIEENNNDFINAQYKEVHQEDEEVETDYKVF